MVSILILMIVNFNLGLIYHQNLCNYSFIRYSKDINYFNLIVPTIDIIRYSYVSEILLVN